MIPARLMRRPSRWRDTRSPARLRPGFAFRRRKSFRADAFGAISLSSNPEWPMRVALFDFDLPDELVALRPAEPRESARLLAVDPGPPLSLEDRRVGELPDLLRPGDCLILNDTRVLPARLFGQRLRGDVSSNVEVTLLKRLDPSIWAAFAKPGRRLKSGDIIRFSTKNPHAVASEPLGARLLEKQADGTVLIGFDRSGAELDRAIAAFGVMPLPPYIANRRQADSRDEVDYQTIFAKRDGAVAAPTAGLHLTAELLSKLEARGIRREIVTLHVGAGTFLPVKVEDTAEHRMHSEWGEVSAATAARLEDVRRTGGRLVAIGTTALRIVETAAAGGTVRPYEGETDIFITPGYQFRAIDALFTNFHLPRSTLAMLVAAFSGFATFSVAYRHAICRRYRFYSYGDASLWARARNVLAN
jgi:S-adenosylmethionine:tRNA ribosyltransferase-isomerase